VSEFVLKIYYAEDAEQSYTNEVSAYKRLAHRKHVGRNVTHFHGSWRQGKTYNILLEYAGQGTLLDYFQNTPPPTRSCDIVAFWKNMLDISAALQQIHAPLRLIDEGPVPFQGYGSLVAAY
jgi:serine/threonine protein kinase